MPVMLEAMNLSDPFDDDDLLAQWVTAAAQSGRGFKGYSGNLYTHTEFGDSEIYTCIEVDKKKKVNELKHFDIHVGGNCVWDMHFFHTVTQKEKSDNMTRLATVRSAKNGGLAVIHLLNADILPSFLPNDEIKAQVVAFALSVDYFEDEEAMFEHIPPCENMKYEEFNGKKFAPAIGSILPNGLLLSHSVDEKTRKEHDEDEADIVLITGKVKAAYTRRTQLGENPVSAYIVTRVDTEFGELEIIHSKEMLENEDLSVLKVGAIVQATAVLSGDVAIYEYENGVVKDHKNDLAALRYTMMEGNAARLASVLADDVIYESINMNRTMQGADLVMKRLDYVHYTTTIEYFSQLATIENTGERCIVIAENESDNYTAIARIEVNEEGLIKKIIVSDCSEMKFKIDQDPVYENPWEE